MSGPPPLDPRREPLLQAAQAAGGGDGSFASVSRAGVPARPVGSPAPLQPVRQLVGSRLTNTASIPALGSRLPADVGRVNSPAPAAPAESSDDERGGVTFLGTASHPVAARGLGSAARAALDEPEAVVYTTQEQAAAGLGSQALVTGLAASPEPVYMPPGQAHGVVIYPADAGENGGDDVSEAPLEGSDAAADLDIVQFSSPMYFVEEQEEKLKIDITRLGSMRGRCKVSYYTQDSSGKAGHRYKAASGTVMFKPGEHTKSFVVDIIEDHRYNTTLEFKVHLKDAKRCELGQYLHVARIKVIDNGMFPSKRFRKEMEAGGEVFENVPAMPFFKDYFRLAFWQTGMGWRTLVTLAFDQMKNFYLFFTLYVNIYLVDVLFNTKEESSKEELWFRSGPFDGRIYTAQAIGLLYVLPMLALHAWDYCRLHLDTEGMAKNWLRLSVFRKYLNYSAESRGAVSASEIQLAILNDTGGVAGGYMATLNVLQHVGKLIVLVYFVLQENPGALMPVIVMPTVMVIFVGVRSKPLTEASKEAAHQMSHVIELVSEASTKYRLIADYAQRPHFCEIFEEHAEEECEAGLVAETMEMHNQNFAKWLGPLFIGSFIAFQAYAVLIGDLSLGTFLATVRIFNELSEQFSEAYEQLMTVSLAVGPLKRLATYLNRPTDLMLWKGVNRKRREHTKIARLEVISSDKKGGPTSPGVLGGASPIAVEDEAPSLFKTDKIKIKLIGLCYGFPTATILEHVSVSVNQGSVVAVVGSHGSGKSTLLRLLGHIIFPTEGEIFIPTHLRILHICQEPMLLDMTAWQNLVFGRPHADARRVCNILERLEMRKTLAIVKEDLEKLEKQREEGGGHHGHGHGHGHGHAGHGKAEAKKILNIDGESDVSSEDDYMDVDKEDAAWEETVSSAEIAKIHLARALIVNPEILVLHRPLAPYDKHTADLVLNLIMEHREKKGLEIAFDSVKKQDRRRPRTVFFTPTTKKQSLRADIIWEVDGNQRDIIEIQPKDQGDYDVQ
eukprot:TRINITY_DN6232_c0_g1_i1.p1 TRINITY_DN6232_c0_g1~~TRINITY_DN6232_c0_g1_i1.p1  ORF type:complete len:1010 (+),score=275.61 TRINITY_DN6232_c0_g1_i1:74-3103(+)